MRLSRPNRKKARGPATQPVILFVVGENTFAISASAVTEIQGTETMKAMENHSFRFGKVHNTITREGRRYWVVDADSHFGMLPTHGTRVLMLSESPVALKVDSIVRMAEIYKVLTLPHSFTGDEQNWYLGLTLINNMVVPVVNPKAFLSRFDMTALEKTESGTVPSIESAGVIA